MVDLLWNHEFSGVDRLPIIILRTPDLIHNFRQANLKYSYEKTIPRIMLWHLYHRFCPDLDPRSINATGATAKKTDGGSVIGQKYPLKKYWAHCHERSSSRR